MNTHTSHYHFQATPTKVKHIVLYYTIDGALKGIVISFGR